MTQHLLKPLLLMAALLPSLNAAAYDFKVDGVFYNKLSDSTCEVTSEYAFSTYKGDIIVPTSVTYNGTKYEVTAIGDKAFYKCNKLTSVNFPDSLKEIGYDAFNGCNKLTSVNFPDSLKVIGISAFCDCTGLTSVTLPNCITNIDNNAFYACYNLTSINIPKSVTNIGAGAFMGCGKQKNGLEIHISDVEAWCKLEFIGPIYYFDLAFGGNYRLILNGEEVKNLVIPNSITKINQYSFCNCVLTSVTIPSSVKNIGEAAFWGYQSFQGATTFLPTVISLSETPPMLDGAHDNSTGRDVFTNDTYENGELLVPSEAVDKYRNADYWKRFKNIKPIGGVDTGVDDINSNGISVTARDGKIVVLGAEADQVIKVYNTMGQLIYSGTDHEIAVGHPGFYIVNGKKLIVK